ncbi:MAG: dihydrolipoamide acetyltransferase [Kofleriaceae bacterium]
MLSSLLIAGTAAGQPATQPPAGAAPTGAAPTGAPPTATTPPIDPATVKPEDMPTAVRMRRLEQKTQALKERAWQLKARIQMLKEQVLGGGIGAQALIAHANEMGSSFRLIKLIYTVDGTQVFARTDETGENLYKTKAFDIFQGPIAPGNHNVSAVATYRGHGYGVFEYLTKYTFTAKGSQTFTTGEGKVSKLDCKGYEKGGPNTPLEKRPAIDCKVTQVSPEKPATESGK